MKELPLAVLLLRAPRNMLIQLGNNLVSRMKCLSLAVCIFAVSFVVSLQGAPNPVTDPPQLLDESGEFIFEPVDDACLDGTRLFNDRHLRVFGDTRISFLKFNVTGLSGQVESATLTIQENGNTGNGTLRFHRGSHNNWTELTLSTATAPELAGEVGSYTGPVISAQILNVDVTPLLNGNGIYTIIITQDAGGNDVRFGSKESSRIPKLTIQIAAVTYNLTVNEGTGSGAYAAGTIVPIIAAPAPPGQQFDQWTGDVADVANVLAPSTSLIMPEADLTITATYKEGGIGGVGPLQQLTATGNAGTVTSINSLPTAELQLGTTLFPNPTTTFPAANADNFELGLVGSADNQPYFECRFEQPVLHVYLLENGGNDSGHMQALDAEGYPIGEILPFTNSSYWRSPYLSNLNQVVAGLEVWMTTPVHGIRITPIPPSAVLGFDPISISASPRPRLALKQSTDGALHLEWFGSNWVLQQREGLDQDWSDILPVAHSPFPVIVDGSLRCYRLSELAVE